MMRETEDVIRSIGKGLVMKMTIKVRCHPEQMRRSCTRGEENGKSNFVINRKETAQCHQCNRFFTPCHCSAYPFSHTAFLPPF